MAVGEFDQAAEGARNRVSSMNASGLSGGEELWNHSPIHSGRVALSVQFAFRRGTGDASNGGAGLAGWMDGETDR